MPVPELFIQRGDLNAFTAGHNNPYVVLTTSLVDGMSDDELLAVIAHELGHIKCSHVLYKTMIGLLTDFGAASALKSRRLVLVLAASLAMPHIQRALSAWNQRSELSADRAAMLVVQDEDACLRMMLKLAGAPSRLVEEMNTEAFLEQAAHLADLTANSDIANRHRRAMVAGSTHPLTVERARQLHLWISEGGVQQVLANPSAAASETASA
jgi:Zn-dependent protease with chaperone function